MNKYNLIKEIKSNVLHRTVNSFSCFSILEIINFSTMYKCTCTVRAHYNTIRLYECFFHLLFWHTEHGHCTYSVGHRSSFTHVLYVCYDLTFAPVFLKYCKFLGIFIIFFFLTSKGLQVITAAILHPNLNVDTHNFLFHSYISAYNVLVLKSVRCVYITPTSLCPYLYSVILCCILLPFAATTA